MKKLKKIMVATLAFTTIISNTVFAKGNHEKNIKDSIKVGEEIMYTVNLILEEYLGDVTSDQIYEAAMAGITNSLDEYSDYFSKKEYTDFKEMLSGYSEIFGITMVQKEDGVYINTVLEGGPAQKAGVLENDKIISVNDFITKDKSLDEVFKYITTLTTDANFVLNRQGKEIKSTLRKGAVKTATVTSLKLSEIFKDSKSYDDAVRYIHVSMIGEETPAEFKLAVDSLKNQGIKKLILDLRDNPGGSLEETIEMCNMILPKGQILETVDASGNKKSYKSTLNTSPFEKIIVLTNKNTASAAEVITAALQDSGSTTIGETTLGKGVIQGVYPTKNGGAIKLTTMEYFRRNGEKINKIGISPNIPVFIPEYIFNYSESVNLSSIKQILSFLAYNVGEINDVMNESTITAIKQFQSKNNLEQTGVIDEKTLEQINLSLNYVLTNTDIVLDKAIEEMKK